MKNLFTTALRYKGKYIAMRCSLYSAIRNTALFICLMIVIGFLLIGYKKQDMNVPANNIEPGSHKIMDATIGMLSFIRAVE